MEFLNETQKAFKQGYMKARQEDEQQYHELTKRLKSLETEANERLNEIPEQFNGLEDSEKWNYWQGALAVIENIKQLLNGNE